MTPGFEIVAASEEDAVRIAAIHLAAMQPNILLHAQFPTPQSLINLEAFLAEHTRSQVRDPASVVLVARDPASREIVSFAKWDLPQIPDPIKQETETFKWSDGCCKEYLDGYAALAEGAKERAIGNTPCYRLTFVCTDPSFQGKGAGSLLTQKVQEAAGTANLPVYLESTVGAVKMYEKLGFVAVDGFEMTIPRRGQEGETDVYEEVCMLWRPGTTS